MCGDSSLELEEMKVNDERETRQHEIDEVNDDEEPDLRRTVVGCLADGTEVIGLRRKRRKEEKSGRLTAGRRF